MKWPGWILAAVLLAGCGSGSEGPPSGSEDGPADGGINTVYAVNYPLAWAAEQLAGDAAEVRFPAPVAIDPAFWEPDLATIADYQQADLILLNGANYAKWLARVSLPGNRLVDTSRSFADQLIAVDAGPVHSHGPEGGHSHGELAFTVWLDLNLYAAQVEAIAAALSNLLPGHAEAITRRRQQLAAELAILDGRLREWGEQLDGAPILFSHPVYQYFQRRYAINGLALHWEPDRAPSENDWVALDAILGDHPARLMLWEAEPLPAVTARLASLGIKPVVFRPQANAPTEGAFVDELRADIDSLMAATNP
jgi:zinc transport system substrate-binding protein